MLKLVLWRESGRVEDVLIVVVVMAVHSTLVMIEVVHMGLIIMMVTIAKPDAARKGSPGDRRYDQCKYDLFHVPSRVFISRKDFPLKPI